MNSHSSAFRTSEPLPGEVSFQLPRRASGGWAVASWLAAGVTAAVLIGVSRYLSRYGAEGTGWDDVLFAAVSIPMWLVALFLVAFGIMLVAGRHTIRLGVTELSASEYVTPNANPSTSVHRIDSIARIEVVRLISARIVSAEDDGLSAIRLVRKSGRRARVAIGYPARILMPLARDLASRCNVAGPQRPHAASTGGDADGLVTPASLSAEPLLIDKPAGSRMQLIRQEDAIGFELPPTGFQGSQLLSVLAPAIAMGAACILYVNHAEMSPDSPEIFFSLVLVTVVMTVRLVYAAISAYQRTCIHVTRDELVLELSGPFRKTRQAWRRSEILQILACPSGKLVDPDRYVLRIAIQGDRERELLGSLSTMELHWLAQSLRRALQMPAPSPGAAGRE